MTTSQAAFRLLRHCSVTDIAALTYSQASEVMGALSAAVSFYFRYGPAILKQTSAIIQLRAPRAVTGLPVVKGAREVSTGSPFTLAERGSSLYLDGDERPNEVVSLVSWLNPYGGTDGSKSGTVYGDCVPVGSRLIERIISDPWIHDARGSEYGLSALKRMSLTEEPRYLQSRPIGRPTHYTMQPTGIVRGSTTQFLIRVWPMPADEMILRCEAELTPDMFDPTNVAGVPLELPFSPDQMESIILPLAEREMLVSTLAYEIPDRTIAGINRRAEVAEQTIRKLPKDHGRTQGRARTPRGY